MQEDNTANGPNPSMGTFQIINETDSIIRGAGEYYTGSKRGSGDAGLDSDSENETTNKFSSSTGFSHYGGPKPGKKTRGRVKIEMKFIDNKLRRYTTFSKRKTGIMKKAYELSTLTGTQVMLLVASETGHVYTFATRKLQPMITSETGKALIQTCLNSPDGANSPPSQATGEQRMNISGFEETEISYGMDEERDEDTSFNANKKQKTSHNTSTSSANPVTATPSYTLEPAGANGDLVTATDTSNNQVTKLFLATDNGGMTTLLGAPKIEKQDMAVGMQMGGQGGAFLMGTPQAIPASIQSDMVGARASPVPQLPGPISLPSLNTTQTSTQQPPEYTDLKPINILNPMIPKPAQPLNTPQPTQQLITSQIVSAQPLSTSQSQQQQMRPIAISQQQAQHAQIQMTSQQPVQGALQQTGLYIPAAVPNSATTTQPGSALVYQTPSAMVYTPSGQEGGFMLSLPPPVSLQGMQGADTGGTAPQIITIPVPVSLPGGQTQIIQVPVQTQPAVDANQQQQQQQPKPVENQPT